MPAGRTLVVAVCAVAAAGATLTGCNDDDDGSAPIEVTVAPVSAKTTTSAKAEPYADLTATQLLKRAEQDMRHAGALTYDLAGRDHGTPMHMKASISSKGTCVAAMDLNGGKAQVIVPGSDVVYIKGDHDFWEQNADGTVAGLLSGKWVKVPSSQFDEGQLGGMCDLNGFMDSMTESDDDEGMSFTRGEPTTLDGKQVIPITQTDEDGAVVIIDISTGAVPYVVRSVDHSADEPGVATFSDFGKLPKITVPPRSETVDPKDFGPGTVHI